MLEHPRANCVNDRGRASPGEGNDPTSAPPASPSDGEGESSASLLGPGRDRVDGDVGGVLLVFGCGGIRILRDSRATFKSKEFQRPVAQQTA